MPCTIRHLVILGFSQWVIGRNVARKSDVLNYGASRILFPNANFEPDSVTKYDDGVYGYIQISRFPAFLTKGQSASLRRCSSDTYRLTQPHGLCLDV